MDWGKREYEIAQATKVVNNKKAPVLAFWNILINTFFNLLMQIIMIEVITPLPQLFLTKFLLIQVFHLAEMK